jgi:hypothetical protein
MSEILMSNSAGLMALRTRYEQLDRQMRENRGTCSDADYLNWHLEKMKIRKALENDNN